MPGQEWHELLKLYFRDVFHSQVKHIQGDRQDYEGLKEKLQGTGFQVVYDINGIYFLTAASSLVSLE